MGWGGGQKSAKKVSRIIWMAPYAMDKISGQLKMISLKDLE